MIPALPRMSAVPCGLRCRTNLALPPVRVLPPNFFIHECGGTEVLKLEEAPLPQKKSDGVLIKTVSVGVVRAPPRGTARGGPCSGAVCHGSHGARAHAAPCVCTSSCMMHSLSCAGLDDVCCPVLAVALAQFVDHCIMVSLTASWHYDCASIACCRRLARPSILQNQNPVDLIIR